MLVSLLVQLSNYGLFGKYADVEVLASSATAHQPETIRFTEDICTDDDDDLYLLDKHYRRFPVAAPVRTEHRKTKKNHKRSTERQERSKHTRKKGRLSKKYSSADNKSECMPDHDAVRLSHRSTVTADQFSSDEEICMLDRNKLRAALKRDVSSSFNSLTAVSPTHHQSSSLEHKLRKSNANNAITTTIAGRTTTDGIISNENVNSVDNKNQLKVSEIIAVSDDSAPEETISLEEQELRLIALKSAILKKHEARKQRKIREARPYSPTDTDILLDSVCEPKKGSFELENMDISPSISPIPQDKTWLHDDMELESDDNNSSMPPPPPLKPTTPPPPSLPPSYLQTPTWNFNEISLGLLPINYQHQNLPPLPPPPPIPNFSFDMSPIKPTLRTFSQLSPPSIETKDKDKSKYIEPNVDDNDEDEEFSLRAMLLSNLSAPTKVVAPVASSPDPMDDEQLRQLLLISIDKKNLAKKQKENRSTVVNLKEAAQRFANITASVASATVNIKSEQSKNVLAVSENIPPQQPTNENVKKIFNRLGRRQSTSPIDLMPNVVESKKARLAFADDSIQSTNLIQAGLIDFSLPFYSAVPSKVEPKHGTSRIVKSISIPLTRSKTITNPNAKKIKKLIIQLNGSDTESDTNCDVVGTDTNIHTLNDNHDVVATPTNASPLLHNTPTAFEHKLDMFLKSVRKKEDSQKIVITKRKPETTASIQKKMITAQKSHRIVNSIPATPLVSFISY